MNPTVCMISYLHSLYDDRIYWKEAVSLKKNGYKVIHLGLSDKTFQTITEEGIILIGLTQKRFFNNIYLDKLFKILTFKKNPARLLLKKAAELNADIYHLHDYQLNKIAKKLKQLPQNPKLINDVHEPYPVAISSKDNTNFFTFPILKILSLYINYLEKSSSKYFDLIITTEENVQLKFKEFHPNTQVDIIYNYVDIPLRNKSDEYEFDFIYCGAIRKRRGVFEVLEAIKILKERNIFSRTLFLGPIHEKGLIEKMNYFIKHNSLEKYILIKDPVPYKQVIDFYNKSKAGLAIFNNYKVNQIIMPIKIFEYLVLELPVITSNFGHMKEITLKNSSGLIVNPDKTNEIADAMEEIISNSNLFNQLKTNCIKASPKYRWEIMEEKLINLYKNLVSDNHKFPEIN